MKNKVPKLTIVVILLLVVAIGVIVFLLTRPPEVVTVGPEIENTGDVEKLEDSINLPGYDSITFKAGKKEQTVMIPNPTENTCLVQITIKLSDSTILWESEEVTPGRYSTPVVFNKALKKGKYKDSILQFNCYTNDKDHAKLNGAECKFTLIAE